MQSILANIIRMQLLQLLASTYEATASTAAAIVSHLEHFDVWFGNV